MPWSPMKRMIVSSARPSACERLEHEADLAVEFAGGVEIARPVFARDRMVGVDRRHDHLGGIRLLLAVEVAVRLLEIDLREERLVRLQVTPLVGVEWLAVVVKFQSVLAEP